MGLHTSQFKWCCIGDQKPKLQLVPFPELSSFDAFDTTTFGLLVRGHYAHWSKRRLTKKLNLRNRKQVDLEELHNM